MPATHLYRITHYKNLPFILDNGLWCANCGKQDRDYINIGHKTLIGYRGKTVVPVDPGGMLNDYVPFYFTKKSPMLYVISKKNVTDYKGTQSEIIYLVSSVEKIIETGTPFVFTDKHAKLHYANFYNSISDLNKIDWSIIKSPDWRNTENDNTIQDKKQAEFLIHKHLSINCILGIVCYNDNINTFVRKQISSRNSGIKTAVRKDFYY